MYLPLFQNDKKDIVHVRRSLFKMETYRRRPTTVTHQNENITS